MPNSQPNWCTKIVRIFARFGIPYGVHLGSLLGTQNWPVSNLKCNQAFEWVPAAPFGVNGGPLGVCWLESGTLGAILEPL